jgi:hypothetical protein
MNKRFSATFVVLLLLVSPIFAFGQSTFLKGQIVDKDDLSPVHGSHIIKNEKTIGVTQLNAEFSLRVNPHDTLIISHVGYKNQVLVVPENSTTYLDTIIFMTKDTTFLQEVKIYGFPTEKGFMRQIMTTNVFTRELINAQNNIYQSQQLYKYGVVPQMDALDNYQSFIRGPQPLVFFSSNPSMGINTALRNAFTSPSTTNIPKRGLSLEESTQLLINLKFNAKMADEDTLKIQQESIVIGK